MRCSLQAGSSGGVKWCTVVFLGCCQTPWNDRAERNVRFPPFIIMVTLKPNYSRLNSSLLAMLLLMAALKCTAWQGAGWAAQTSHWSLEGHEAAEGILGLAASGTPAPGLCGGQELQWNPLRGDTGHATKASAWQGPQRPWPHHLRNSAVQDCAKGWLRQKIKPRGSTSVVVPPERFLKAPRAPVDPQLLQDTFCRQITTTSVAVTITQCGLITSGAAFLLQDLPPPLCFMVLSLCTPKTKQLSLDLECPSILTLPRKTTTGNPALK